MTVFRRSVAADWGRFMLESNEKGLTRVLFPDHAVSFSETEEATPVLDSAVEQFKNYFLGELYDFRNLSYDFSCVSGFQEKVLIALLKLPVQTVSYSELARLAGSPRASRAVGNAMNQNPFPILIPCHRVIRADGELGQYAFGKVWKERLLRHEKILQGASSAVFSEPVLSDIIAAV